MSDDPNTPLPNPSDDDEELIAYLDGELDEYEAKAVEHRLTSDATARARAEEYQKSYDLLDYLPKPVPSPDFAARTLTALQPAAGVARSGSHTPPSRSSVWRGWLTALGWTAAAVLAAVGGYSAHRLIAPSLEDRPPATAEDFKLMGKLPLYAGVDDIDFLRELDRSGLFDGESGISTTVTRHPDQSVVPILSDSDRDALYAQFRTFPESRQQQLRTLHLQLNDQALPDRESLVGTLEAYALWLNRLPEPERRLILDASPAKRLDEVRSVHTKQWREGLSEGKRRNLQQAVGEERMELATLYREDEQARRNEWRLAQRQWKELTEKNQTPWPFNDPVLSRQIDEHLTNALGVNPSRLPVPDRERRWELPPGCRLTREQVQELRLRRQATAEGYWFTYGALLLRLSEQYPTLPRPKSGNPIVRPADLPRGYTPIRDGPGRLRSFTGKWPDFALEVARLSRGNGKLEPLGPCRPEEFTDPVRQFVQTALDDADRKKLQPFLGRWPAYPQKLIELAREKNLSVPEVMLPGEPKKWQEYYQLPGGKK